MFADQHPRLYLWVRWRSVGLHALMAVIAAGCSTAAWWQIHRAVDGNTLSYVYSVEWPVFVIVAAFGWWQLVHDTDDDIARRRAYHERVRRASAEVVARTLPRSVTALTVGSQEVSGRVLPPGRPTDGLLPAPTAVTPVAVRAPAGEEAPVEPADLTDMDDYNRYLATLAVKGRAKTWRHPRGE